ncbi:hypothetical protein [Thermoplasma sp.]|uniref:hypothetical protein n=1 Tax=Thermoplasma sp. TaxID=1973142 RepID=UPI00260D689A|nr:hypothetical protein [Thermoplasma sp.]
MNKAKMPIPLFDSKGLQYLQISRLTKQVSDSVEAGESLDSEENKKGLNAIDKVVSRLIQI